MEHEEVENPESSPRPPVEFSLDDPDFDKKCQQLVQEFLAGNETIVNIVQKLEPFFLNLYEDVRNEGLRMLAAIIEHIPILALKHDEFVYFCKFYESHLDVNYKQISSVLNGIQTLSLYDSKLEPPSCLIAILKTMFRKVSCQGLPQYDRNCIYNIFRNVLRSQTEDVLAMGEEFVKGVLSAIDCERDPRNLLFVFEWLPEFINTVTLGDQINEMFDIISCYFPVDFRVPAMTVNSISRVQLAQALKMCLCASPEFTDSTITLAHQKLDSDLQLAKEDALELLLAACKKFTADAFVRFQSGLWSYLPRELLKCHSAELERLLLATITEIARKVSAHNDGEHFIEFFIRIVDTNALNLDVSHNLFTPTWKLFLAIGKANRTCARLVLDLVAPQLINAFFILETKEQLHVFQVLTEFIKCGDEMGVYLPIIPPLVEVTVSQQDDSLCALALHACCFISKQLDGIKLALFEQFREMFTEELASDRVQEAFYTCIKHYAVNYREDIVAIIGDLQVNGADDFEVALQNVGLFSGEEPFTALFLQFMIENYDKYASSCLVGLRKSLDKNVGNEQLHKAIHDSNILNTKVMKLDDLTVTDNVNLENIQIILHRIMEHFTLEQQAAFLKEHDEWCGSSSDSAASKHTHVFSGVFMKLHLEIVEAYSESYQRSLLTKMFELSTAGDESALLLLANFINKFPDIGCIRDFEQKLRQEEGGHHGSIVVWITKALYMRGHVDSQRWLGLLVDYLPHSSVVATTLKVVLSEDCDALSASSHVRRMFLYRQKFFAEICPLLDKAFVAANSNYARAFGALMQSVPAAILRLQIEKLIRLIILCLDDAVETMSIPPVLLTIGSLIQARDPLAAQYMGDFLPRLLAIATTNPSMQVRISSLQCVKDYGCVNANCKLHDLLPFKSTVVEALGKCIGDKKRLVRKEAVAARLAWFSLGAPI